LTINKNQKTKDIYNSKYVIPGQFHKPAPKEYDKTDHGTRRFRNYSEFTKKFDRVIIP